MSRSTSLRFPTPLGALFFATLVAGCGGGGGGGIRFFPDGGSNDMPAGARCNDGTKNGDETDVDCGSSCGPCAVGKGCRFGNDCQSGVCLNAVCVPAMGATCIDGAKNGTETDVDCGGPACMKCGNGKLCLMNTDCVSNLCGDGFCFTNAASCADGTKNGSETDVDCGGGTCSPCVNGKACNVNNDCQSANCQGGTCAPGAGPSCLDGIKNGNETDVDCGGGVCPRCPDGLICRSNSDCQSGMCSGGRCVTVQQFGCSDSVGCINNCMDNTCFMACVSMINTPNGQALLQAIFDCFEQTCPTMGGGVCDQMSPNYNQAACDSCFQGSQMPNGACYNDLMACLND